MTQQATAASPTPQDLFAARVNAFQALVLPYGKGTEINGATVGFQWPSRVTDWSSAVDTLNKMLSDAGALIAMQNDDAVKAGKAALDIAISAAKTAYNAAVASKDAAAAELKKVLDKARAMALSAANFTGLLFAGAVVWFLSRRR
jgi:hypothetical protein